MDERRAERGTVVSKLVLDVLKPHQPSLVEFARSLTSTKSVERVNASVMEVDAETETVKLVIEGRDLDMEEISETVRRLGGVVHSVDEVVVEVRRSERKA
ncbi:MAG: DUF211 domain-containing protein [Candidatus Caldarchaeales archaeon]